MRILIVHPVMTYLGGGESLCCETIRVLKSLGHELTLLSEHFDPKKVEAFFGQDGLFDRVNLSLYAPGDNTVELGTIPHLMHHLRGQRRALKSAQTSGEQPFDLVFSTQDAGYIPDMSTPVLQWGYFPRTFPRTSHYSPRSFLGAIRLLPLRLHYEEKISRIGLVLAISEYSKWHFDKEWKRPSVVVYPSCNMLKSGEKRNLIVTAARAVPEKRLELFWQIARLRPEYKFLMLAIRDSHHVEYARHLSETSPKNGTIIFNSPNQEYRRLLGEASVYIHLMREERFGITIVEAMSASCVPIIHDSGAPKEIVDNKVGFRWNRIVDVPPMIDEALRRAPSDLARRRAEDFNGESFETRLSSVFSELQ